MIFEKLTKTQKKAWNIFTSNQYIEILFDGAARAGKTFLICMYCICLCLKHQGIRILMARYAFNHAKSSIWIQTLLPMLETCFTGAYEKNSTDFIIRIGKSEIWLGGLDEKERTEKILGQEYAVIFLNEAVQISPSTRNKVKTRLAQRIPGFNNFIVYDCNPRNPSHYLFKEFYIEKNDKKISLKWTPDDNKDNLSDGYIENMLDTLAGTDYKRFRLGEWCNVEGAVYTNIHDNHIIECDQDIYRYDDLTLGIDFGLHTSIGIWAHKENKSYCLWECTLQGASNTTTKKIIAKLDEIEYNYFIKEKGYTVYCDHEPDRIEELWEAGYNAKKAYKDVSPGDGSVNERELYFDIDCPNTFQSMLNLMHEQDKNDNYIEKHVKENDHEADQARYAIHGYKMDGQGGDPVFIPSIY